MNSVASGLKKVDKTELRVFDLTERTAESLFFEFRKYIDGRIKDIEVAREAFTSEAPGDECELGACRIEVTIELTEKML